MLVLWTDKTFFGYMSDKRQSSKSGLPISRPLVQAQILLATRQHTSTTFIDSGADGNIMAENLAGQLGVSLEPLSQAVSASDLTGHSLKKVTPWMVLVCMWISGLCEETI